MRVVVAPDKFAGSLTALEAARAIARGWSSTRPADEVVVLPMSDGGPGFCDVLETTLAGSVRLSVPTTDPLGRPVLGTVLLGSDGRITIAYVESAQAAGLHLLSEGERDPERTSTAGLAALLAAAVRSGAERIVVGLGGSATNDGGRAMVEALDPETLGSLRELDLVLASDVDNPLLGPSGASAVFAPQKGASREAVARLEGRMQEWVALLPGLDQVAGLAGAGAAGGLGAALLWLGGRREPGAAMVAAAIGLGAALVEADLVVTGEGTFDVTSLRAKVVAEVAKAAQGAALPCLVLAGQVAVGQREAAAHGVDEAVALTDLAGSVEVAIGAAERWLTEAASGLARRWGV